MNKFPEEINIKDKVLESDSFSVYNYDRVIKLLRQEIYDLIVSRKDENEYFDLDTFSIKNNYNYHKLIQMLNEIVLELDNLGWKTKLSFGNTGLFIYSSDDTPSSCW
jgi:hypothetical protein